MKNNDILTGFDEDKPRLDPSWIYPDQISWIPLKVKLENDSRYPDLIIARIEGEIEAFNGSYLASKLINAIDAGIRCIYLDLEKTTLGDYREVLMFGIQKRLLSEGGLYIIKNPPRALEEYWQFIFGALMNEFKNLHIVKVESKAISLIEDFENNKERYKENLKTVEFPFIFLCPICGARLRAKKPCSFICAKCKSTLKIDEYGKMVLI